MKVLVIDGQGGGIGRQLVSAIKQNIAGVSITAVGTNSAAASAMIKAGADHAATGENAVIVGCRNADVIVGTIGIVMADAMLGEITSEMALAVARSNAKRVLIPYNHCNNIIVGISDFTIGKLIQDAVNEIQKMAAAK